METLFENRDLIVVIKPRGVLSEESGNKRSMPLLLREELAARGEKDPKVLTVHRLDRDVGGVMVFAKNGRAASDLAQAIARREVGKEYLAVVIGAPQEERGVFEDLLFHDAKSGKTYVAERMRRGVRDAKLSYEVLGRREAEGVVLTLVKVKLYTGRTHQIRVQFASRGLPLYGDRRYGGRESGSDPALFSWRLTFPGAFDCRALPKGLPFTLFGEELEKLRNG